MDTDNWPTFAGELGRKAMTQFQRWAELNAAGKITDRELYVVLDTLYETTVGLIPMDQVDLIVEALTELREEARRRRAEKAASG